MSDIILLTVGYPSEDNIYNAGFVHKRVLEYHRNGVDVQVVLVSKTEGMTSYDFEGINVQIVPPKKLRDYLTFRSPEKILIHFLTFDIIKALSASRLNDTDLLIWVHGHEALGWYRRLFAYKNPMQFLRYILENTRQMFYLHRFVADHKNNNMTFIFVSNWMKRIMEFDTLTRLDNFCIIPNFIDTSLFSFKKKPTGLRKNIFLVRSFDSRKYANDIAIEAILLLSKQPLFNELNFSIYGKGHYFHELTDKLRVFPNIKITEQFLSHAEIAEQHSKHGIFLCPTRQDAQGVSMCEAMSSGLVPITSNSTAIPEFVVDNKSGYLTNSSGEIAEKIAFLYNNPSIFEQMSISASESIKSICSAQVVIKKELELILG